MDNLTHVYNVMKTFQDQFSNIKAEEQEETQESIVKSIVHKIKFTKWTIAIIDLNEIYKK